MHTQIKIRQWWKEICVVLVNADRKKLLLLNHSLNFVPHIEYSCRVPVILDSDHSSEKKHHPGRPVMWNSSLCRRTLSSSLNKNKYMSILCPLITSTLLYSVKALHGRCPYHCIMRKYTRVQRPCFNKVNHFHCSVRNVFQDVRHSLGSKSLSVDAAVYRREQLLARVLPLHYVPLSWLLHHQYRYQHILTTKGHLMSQRCPVL